MGGYIGGSAFSMASHIAEGNVLLTPVQLKKLSPAELRSLETEVEKLAREVRGQAIPLDDTVAVQKRNRKLSRLTQATQIIRSFLMARH